ncbi:hypothetical protein GCM10010187_30030 [Actinomadura coerulea]|nr:AIPR family protein [Actinomadura coerulea]GGQ11877.1 hypothetical protein GCM10010187_30030 [Actinomadura coerulea]
MIQPSAANSPGLAAFNARTDLTKYGDNALLLFALQIGLEVEDIDSIATNSLTDGSDDKKCDLVYVDRDSGRAIVAQGYYSRKERSEAPANKASDLNTAAAWLLGTDSTVVPERLKPAQSELHEAICAEEIRRVEIWFVHNLPESKNVKEELEVARRTARAHLDDAFPGNSVEEVFSREIGRNTLDRWYRTSQVPILVTDEISVPAHGGFFEEGDNWEAYCTSVAAEWLTELFKQHGTDLFSANVRDYLGSINRDVNINNNIKTTAEASPDRFFAYNNGLTALVNEFVHPESPSDDFGIRGLSIVNGAQTTGALASSSATAVSLAKARVMIRFVKCSDQRVIQEIIQFNNSQNKIEAADFRSNDKTQDQLRRQFKDIPEAEYKGARRGSEKDVIERRPNLIATQTAAQAIAAFHGKPSIAYNETKRIWSSDEVYSQVFPEYISARHVVFCYSLLKAIEEAKLTLMSVPATQRTDSQKKQLAFFQRRGSIVLMTTAVASCLESILGRRIQDIWRLRYESNLSPRDAIAAWRPILLPMLSFVNQLDDALTGYLKNSEKNESSIERFKQLVEATHQALPVGVYETFAASVTDSLS